MGSLVLWVTVGRRMMLKYAGESVINAFREPTDELKEAIEGLTVIIWNWLNSPQFDVDAKNEKGEPIKAKMTPMQTVISGMIDEIVTRTLTRIRGVEGAVKRGQDKMEDELMRGLGIPMPRKGQKTEDYVKERIVDALLPRIEKKLSAGLTNNEGDGSQGLY